MNQTDPTTRTDFSVNRSSAVLLMNETLARAHSRERLREAEQERMVRELRSSQRLQRRAERAARRARKLAYRASVALARVN